MNLASDTTHGVETNENRRKKFLRYIFEMQEYFLATGIQVPWQPSGYGDRFVFLRRSNSPLITASSKMACQKEYRSEAQEYLAH